MRRYADNGDRHAALRQFERLDRALRRELGVAPGGRAVQLRDRLLAEHGAAPAADPADDRPRHRAGDRGEALAGHRVRAQPDADHHRPGRGGQVVDGGRDRRAGGRVGLRGRAGHVGRGRGGVAVRAGRGGARRPVPAAAGPARRAARRAPPEIDRALAGFELSWTGASSHQRLFVAATELVRLAADSTGVLLTVDDVHEADDASLRLLHYIARSTRDQRVCLVLTHRPAPRAGTLSRHPPEPAGAARRGGDRAGPAGRGRRRGAGPAVRPAARPPSWSSGSRRSAGASRSR